MAPGILTEVADRTVENGNGYHSKTSYREPLKASGALDTFTFEEATPVIGREYPTLNIVDDLLNASNADDLIRDLAIASKSIRISSEACTNLSCSLPTRRGLLQEAGQSYR